MLDRQEVAGDMLGRAEHPGIGIQTGELALEGPVPDPNALVPGRAVDLRPTIALAGGHLTPARSAATRFSYSTRSELT